MKSSDPLTKLYVEITTACNLDCQMCVRRVWNEPIGSMPLATFEELMDQLSYFPTPPTIHLGGYGEPMFHPNFLEIVSLAKRTGARIELTTNGMLLSPDMVDASIDLDLDSLTVSIDGIGTEAYSDIRVKGSFDLIVENLLHLRRVKIRRRGRHGNPHLGIAFVAMKRNIGDLPKLPRLAARLGATRILVSNLIPHTPEMEKDILYDRSLQACAFRASRWVPELSLPKFDLDANTLAPVQATFDSTASLSLLDASLSGRNDYCRFAQAGYAAVRWDGQVSPCLELLHDHPIYLRGRRKEVFHHAIGNTHDSPLSEIWTSPEFSTHRAKLRRFPFSPCTTCGGCERFRANIEDCTDNAFPTCGGCLWAQGFVQCP